MAKLAASLLLLAIAMAQLVAFSSAAPLNCGTIANKFAPCLSYLIGRSPAPAPACCNNIRVLNSQFVGPSRVAACQCIKKNAAAISNLRQDRAASIAGVCKVPVSIQISPSTDCSKA